MAWIAVHQGPEAAAGTNVAAVRLHGFYGSVTEAFRDARRLAQEQADVQSYVVDECHRWLPVQAPSRETAVEEEEIGAPENDDPHGGRMGSVCDLRPSAATPTPRVTVETEGTPPPGALFPRGREAEGRRKPTDEKEKPKEILDTLLNQPIPPATTTGVAYAALRERYARLRAFERRLRELLADGQQKCDAARTQIHDLDARHPEYRGSYRERYTRALRESGVKPESVGFMRHLDEIDAPAESGECPTP